MSSTDQPGTEPRPQGSAEADFDPTAGAADPDPGEAQSPVPIRTILTTIGLVVATAAALYVLLQLRQVITWIIIAAFFAVALAPAVGWLERRVFGQRRALATLVLFLLVVVVLIALAAAFILPLAAEAKSLATQLPQLIEQTKQGKGPIGDLLQRTNALEYVQNHQAQIRSFATGLTTPAAGVLRGIVSGVAAAVTIFVLAYLMVLEGPKIVDGTLTLFKPRTAVRIRRVASDCARSITGYISGNLLISVIAGVPSP